MSSESWLKTNPEMSLASLVVQSPGRRTTREECGRLTRDERRASPWSPSQVTLAHLSEERQPRDTGPETLQRQLRPTVNERFNLTSTERFFGLLKVATTTTRAGGSRKSRSTSAMPIWHCFASLPTFAARSRVGTTTKFYLERVLSNHLQSKPTI